MTYTRHTWQTGDVVSVARLNNIEDGVEELSESGGGYDAVIRLVHADNSGPDSTSNLTPSIFEGTFEQLHDKLLNGMYPCILVQYYHPWGTQFSAPMGYVNYYNNNGITITISGVKPQSEFSCGLIGSLSWGSDDSIEWV